jgi:hypothetical protein
MAPACTSALRQAPSRLESERARSPERDNVTRDVDGDEIP